LEVILIPYPQAIEQMMTRFYQSLSEKDRRRYAAMEAIKLGHGGINYIAGLLGCCRDTISKAQKELKELPIDCGYDPRIRQQGGGRKPYDQSIDGIDEAFLDVVKDNIAGEPTDECVLWTNLTHDEIAQRLLDQHGMKVSETVIRQLLTKHNFTRRKAQKKKR
jgi:hypothetical protein